MQVPTLRGSDGSLARGRASDLEDSSRRRVRHATRLVSSGPLSAEGALWGGHNPAEREVGHFVEPSSQPAAVAACELLFSEGLN